MTRRGAHKGGYHWGGGGIDIGRRRFDEIMGRLLVGLDDLMKLEGRLSEWRRSPVYPDMREALKAVNRIHRSALTSGHQATKFALVRAGHLSRKLVKKAVRAKSKLQSMLRNAPPPVAAVQKSTPQKSTRRKSKPRLGGLSQREKSGRLLPPDPPRIRKANQKAAALDEFRKRKRSNRTKRKPKVEPVPLTPAQEAEAAEAARIGMLRQSLLKKHRAGGKPPTLVERVRRTKR